MIETQNRHRGFTLVYAMIIMVALTGFVSFGVDVGRIQLVKTELLHAADAAARAAVAQLSNGITATQNAAVTWAGYNTANGTTVVIDPTNDIDFGTYDTTAHTFTVLTGAARSTANSVRVWARRTAAKGNATTLIFGPTFGVNSCDANASAVAYIATTQSAGIVGLNSMTLNQGASGYIYSYDSSSTTLSSPTNTSKATVASNAGIYMNNTYIYGDVKSGVGQSFSYGGSSNLVSGTSGNLTTALSYAAASVGSYDNSTLSGTYYNGTDFSMSNGTYSMPAGNYSVRNFSMSGGTINCQGNVIIYVSGTFSMSKGTLNAYSSHPGNFRVNVIGSGSCTQSSGTMEADIYGPGASFAFSNGTLGGRVIVGSLTQTGKNVIYQDTYLTGVGWGSAGGGAISSVR